MHGHACCPHNQPTCCGRCSRPTRLHCCRALIPMHPDLKYAGVLPPLDAPHHLRSTE